MEILDAKTGQFIGVWRHLGAINGQSAKYGRSRQDLRCARATFPVCWCAVLNFAQFRSKNAGCCFLILADGQFCEFENLVKISQIYLQEQNHDNQQFQNIFILENDIAFQSVFKPFDHSFANMKLNDFITDCASNFVLKIVFSWLNRF